MNRYLKAAAILPAGLLPIQYRLAHPEARLTEGLVATVRASRR